MQKSVKDVISKLNLEEDIQDYIANLIIDAVNSQSLNSLEELEELIGQHLLMHEIVSNENEITKKCQEIYASLLAIMKDNGNQTTSNPSSLPQVTKLVKPVRISGSGQERKKKEEKSTEKKSK